MGFKSVSIWPLHETTFAECNNQKPIIETPILAIGTELTLTMDFNKDEPPVHYILSHNVEKRQTGYIQTCTKQRNDKQGTYKHAKSRLKFDNFK